MKKIFYILTVAAAALSLVACASAEKMAKMADQVTVSCNPSVLAVKGGVIPAVVSVTYPENFFNKKAILEVTPVLVYEGGEEILPVLNYQGEKVANNYKVVPASGSTVTESFVFPYKAGMAKSTLELRGRCTVNGGSKWVFLPTKKVADGCNITETLVCKCGKYDYKADNYQAIITLNPEGQVLYNINSYDVRSSELKGKSVKDFKAALAEVSGNERKTLTGIDIVAYASPDGPEAQNIALSDNRSKSAKKAFDKVTKKEKVTAPTVKSVGEDWAGFQEMVQKSSLEDKDLILRVLGMYNDSNVREKEIKNMSAVYQDLAKDILPQLRRARFIANVQYKNYTDAELLNLIKENIEVLDEEALLKAATLCKSLTDKKALYNKAVEKFNSNRAKFNLACVALCEKDSKAALDYIKGCEQDADALNIKGVCELRAGKIEAAKSLFEASNTQNAVKNAGICDLLQGNYAAAVKKCGDKGCEAAIANLLNGDAKKALSCVNDAKCPKCLYVKAICLNRLGQTSEAKAALAEAVKGNDELAARAKVDIEFANLQ